MHSQPEKRSLTPFGQPDTRFLYATSPISDIPIPRINAFLAADARIDVQDQDGRTPPIYNAEDEASVVRSSRPVPTPPVQAKDGTTALSAARKAGCTCCAFLPGAALEQHVNATGPQNTTKAR